MNDKIPFDIDLWKSGKYDAETRSGRKVISLHYHSDIHLNSDNYYCISAAINGRSSIDCFTISGNFNQTSSAHEFDLFLAPKKRKVWIAIRQEKLGNDKFYITSQAYDTWKELIDNSAINGWHIIEVELPE